MSQKNCRILFNQVGRPAVKECELLTYCQEIEPLGICLPCEALLPFEAAGEPAPQGKPRGKAKHNNSRDILLGVWPETGSPVSITELMQATGRARSTVQGYVNRAIERGDVVMVDRVGPSLLYELVEK